MVCLSRNRHVPRRSILNECVVATRSLTRSGDAAGKTVHVVLTVRDNGTPPLAAYRRVIVKASSESVVSYFPPPESQGGWRMLGTPEMFARLRGWPGEAG